MVATYRSVEVTEPGGAITLTDRLVHEPGDGEVLVRVEACGVCHSDSQIAAGHLPDTVFPVTPGHEVAGHIKLIGRGDTTVADAYLSPVLRAYVDRILARPAFIKARADQIAHFAKAD